MSYFQQPEEMFMHTTVGMDESGLFEDTQRFTDVPLHFLSRFLSITSQLFSETFLVAEIRTHDKKNGKRKELLNRKKTSRLSISYYIDKHTSEKQSS